MGCVGIVAQPGLSFFRQGKESASCVKSQARLKILKNISDLDVKGSNPFDPTLFFNLLVIKFNLFCFLIESNPISFLYSIIAFFFLI